MRIVLFILVFLSASVFAQQAAIVVPDTVFYNIYGGPNQEEAKDFVETFDKGFFICGSSSSYGQGASSVYLVKTDSLGRFKWGKTYGGINADRGMSICNTPDKGAYISGFSNSFGNFDYDAYCIKVDSAGTLEWEHTYAGNDWDFIHGSALVADSGLVMVGETYSNTAGDADAYLIRINKLGDTLWTKKFGTAYHERFNSITIINDKIYACGKIYDPAVQTTRGLIVCYSLSGALLNSRIVVGTSTWNYELNSITKTINKELLIGGGIVDPVAATTLQQNDFRMRIDTGLVNVWEESSPAFVTTKTCKYLFEDARQHIMGVFTVNGGSGKTAMFLADYTNLYLFGSTYGGLEEEEGVKGMITSRNKLAYLGNTYSYGFGDEDYWLVLFKADTLISDQRIKFKYYTDTISLSPISIKESTVAESKLFPNPVSGNGTLTLKQGNGEHVSAIELIDIQGRKIFNTSSVVGKSDFSIDLSRLSLTAGIYFIRLTGENGVQTIKISVQD